MTEFCNQVRAFYDGITVDHTCVNVHVHTRSLFGVASVCARSHTFIIWSCKCMCTFTHVHYLALQVYVHVHIRSLFGVVRERERSHTFV